MKSLLIFLLATTSHFSFASLKYEKEANWFVDGLFRTGKNTLDRLQRDGSIAQNYLNPIYCFDQGPHVVLTLIYSDDFREDQAYVINYGQVAAHLPKNSLNLRSSKARGEGSDKVNASYVKFRNRTLICVTSSLVLETLSIGR